MPQDRLCYEPGQKRPVDGSGNSYSLKGLENFDVWADLNSSNQLQMRRLYGDGIDQVVARINSGGTAAWYLPDRLGSVRHQVDGSGVLSNTVTYDSFGVIGSESNGSFGDRYKYTAREWDSDVGLQGNRVRPYAPAI